MSLDPSALTPGIIDGYALRAFTNGACSALAIALHDATGWPIVAITDAHNVFDGVAGGGSALHWTVRAPDGRLLDIDGLHDEDDLLERYHGEADDDDEETGEPRAAIGRSTRADALEWYEVGSASRIPLRLAASFVSPLLEKTGLSRS